MRSEANSILIAPSILAADFGHLADQVNACEAAGADWIHCDVMDGHYVPNLTFGPGIIKQLKEFTSLPLDVHLMITNPEQSLNWYKDAGADWLTVHPETCQHLDRTLRRIRELGMKAGIVLNPGSSLSLLEPVINLVDLVLIMSVNPGFGGQKFIAHSIDRLREAREIIDRSNNEVHLSVDGGISPDNAALVIQAGADVLVAGTSVFKDNPKSTILIFRKAINGGSGG